MIFLEYCEGVLDFSDNNISVTIPFNFINVVGDKVGDKSLNDFQARVLAEIRNNPNITKPQLMTACNLRKTSIVSKHLRTMLRIIIWKQWKVPSKRQWGLERLGIDRDRARQTAYMGDHYQFVCTKLCVRNAISKEKPVRKGPVDPLDYYLGKAGFGVRLVIFCFNDFTGFFNDINRFYGSVFQ